ncbi:MAG: hypothetical protein M3Q48_10995, partial [Actinomycetota bacterium]|nr:hypothetical protein [Actinomycetota bacterium]
ASAIERVAGRVEGAGAQGPEAAERLRTVASQVRAGGGSDDASVLVGDVDQWRADGRLTPAAAAEVIAVLDRVPGVDATALTTTTTTPTTTTTTATTTTARAEDEEKDEEGDDDGDEEKGKRGRGKGRG